MAHVGGLQKAKWSSNTTVDGNSVHSCSISEIYRPSPWNYSTQWFLISSTSYKEVSQQLYKRVAIP